MCIRDRYMGSTPRFINYLTDISSELIFAEDKITELKSQLRLLNKKLPSNVYIPFVKEQIRTYVILHIPPSEAKIFITKGKCPYLIACEVFDPLEIVIEPEIRKIDPFNLPAPPSPISSSCLLYTSDAADDTPCVDLGGRRIIKKKTKTHDHIQTHTHD
eukprot:TRINITY_DN44240_c0_g1_i2.p1 TRINITY_DN44240_c0_g1~~TRINITY_DN44240_c0_g1_i2.p1  ORF type:complete len:159 (-),score=35.82 TRINITY_DN44240_c0_g1_i2:60-536(-)